MEYADPEYQRQQQTHFIALISAHPIDLIFMKYWNRKLSNQALYGESLCLLMPSVSLRWWLRWIRWKTQYWNKSVICNCNNWTALPVSGCYFSLL